MALVRDAQGPCCARGGGENGHSPDCPRNSVGLFSMAARAIWLFVRENGLEKDEWGFSKLPDKASNLPEILALRSKICSYVGEDRYSASKTQLLLRLPDFDNQKSRIQYEPHVDKTPRGYLYRRVVGCCLTTAPYGTVIVEGKTLGFRKGEIFGWAGDVIHQGVLNLDDAPRLTAYWRFL